MTFRIAPGLKEALRSAAEREHRSNAELVGVLIRDYCRRHGIAIADSSALSDEGCEPHKRSAKLIKLKASSSSATVTAGLPKKRRDKRINVVLPVIMENATGDTRDVSASGVFFWLNGTCALGYAISFAMGRKAHSGEFLLKCRGVGFRTEPRGEEIGVAVRITEPAMERVRLN